MSTYGTGLLHVLNPRKEALEEDDSDKPTLEFRRKARVWALYLEDAEREAREIVDIWRTSLDSLLIFVGLFAGIVSAFIIDARSDIQIDSEQNLLTGIRDALRHPPIDTVIQISASSKWINILWLLSLQITLFSAVIGVLAKEWLAMFSPATTRREAGDACRRYRLDAQVKLWRVESVITLVPLLVQVGSFLFSMGLIVRCLTDDRTVGYILLAFFLAGGVVYLTMSLLPLIVPSSPFHTPLSSFFAGAKKAFALWRSYRDRMSRVVSRSQTDDDNEVLGDILYTKLIQQSHKPENIDEAAAEIALPSFKPKWIHYLCTNDTPRHLLSRFKRCATTRTDNIVVRNATLRNHLLAFLRFVDHFAEELARCTDVDALLKEYPVLLKALQKSLEPTHPIHRWNNLDDDLTPLLFGLRAQVLILLQSIPERHRLADYIPRSILDFRPGEMVDRPWELAFQDVRSQDRLYLMLSACRGVLQGPENLKAISTTILSLRLAKEAGCLAMETESTSEWAGAVQENDRVDAERHVQTFLLELFKVIVAGWEEMASVELQTPSSSATMVIWERNSSSHQAAGERVLEILVSTLIHPNREVRAQAIAMLVAKQAQPTGLKYGLFTHAQIKSVSKMVVYEDADDARENALSLLVGMAQDDASQKPAVTSALVECCRSGFKQGPSQQMLAIDFVRSLKDAPDGPFHSIIGEIIPDLINLAWDTVKTDTDGWAAMNLVDDLWTNPSLEYMPKIKVAFTETVNAGLDNDSEAKRCQTLKNLRDLLKKGESENSRETAWGTKNFSQGVVAGLFQKIVEVAIHDNDSSVREEAQLLLKQLGRNEHLKESLRIDVLDWLTTAQSPTNPPRVRNAAVLVSGIFVERLDPSAELLQMLIGWAGGDNDAKVRWSSLMLASTICSRKALNVEIMKALKTGIASVKDSVVKETLKMRTAWITLLKDLIRLHSLFSDAVCIILELGAIDSDSDLNDSEPHKGDSGPEYMFRLGESETEYIEAIEASLSQTLSLSLSLQDLSSKLSMVSESVKFLIDLSRTSNLQDTAAKFLTCIARAIQEDIQASEAEVDSKTPGPFPRAPVSSQLQAVSCLHRIKWVYLVATLAAAGHSTAQILRMEALSAISNLTRTYKGIASFGNFQTGMNHSNWRVRQVWVGFARTQITDANSPFLPVLLNTLIEDADTRVREEAGQALYLLLESEDASAAFKEDVSVKLRALDSVLDLESGAKLSRVAAIRFFSHLKGLRCSEECKCVQQSHESLSRHFDDEKMMSRLANVAIKGDHKDLRQCALRLLKEAFTVQGQPQQRRIKAAVQKVIESSLQDHESEFRANVLDVIDDLTSGNEKDRFRGFFLPSIPHLLKAILIDGDERSHEIIGKIFFQNLALLKESDLIKDVFIAIFPLVANITTFAGKSTALRLVEDLSTSDEVASSMVGNLTRMLRNTSPFARATALEMLRIMYRKHGHSRPLMVDLVGIVPDITALALDDKNNEIWTPAIQLLIALSASSSSQFERPPSEVLESPSTPRASYNSIPLQLKTQVAKFMLLLESDGMRSPIVELLSLLSVDSSVRQAVSLGIASKVFTLGSTKLQEGHIELLTKLISDGRFQDEATDYMMLYLAHTLVPTKTEFSQYRVKILTGLWCRYGSKLLQEKASFDKLSKWFNFALFGKHATVHEATAWKTLCDLWLGKADHPTGPHPPVAERRSQSHV